MPTSQLHKSTRLGAGNSNANTGRGNGGRGQGRGSGNGGESESGWQQFGQPLGTQFVQLPAIYTGKASVSGKRKPVTVMDVHNVDQLFEYGGSANAPVLIVTDNDNGKGTVDKKSKKASMKRRTQALKATKAESPALGKYRLSPRTLRFHSGEPREERLANCVQTKETDAQVKWAQDFLKRMCHFMDERWTVPPKERRTKEEKEAETRQFYAFTTLDKLLNLRKLGGA